MRDLDIRISPFQFIQLLKCDLYCSVNQHAKAYVEAIISADDEDAYVEMALEEIVAEISCTDDAGEDVTLLKGLVTDLSIDSRNGLKQMNLTIRSATVLMDLVEYTRTYQNPGFTMSNILDSIGYYPDYNYVMSVGTSAPVEDMIVQYKETDWEFIKRMASRYNSVVLPDYVNGKPWFHFGLPAAKKPHEINDVFYQMHKDVYEFEDKASNRVAAVQEKDAIYYRIEDREIYRLGDAVAFKGRELRVYSIESHLEGQELVHHYVLKTEAGFGIKQQFNEKMIGASLEGYVINVANDLVQVQLNVDTVLNQSGARWLAFSTVYSSPDGSGWYAMPELGDCIRLYLPTEHENEAYVVSSVNLQATDGVSRTDPSRKSIKNINGKEILLTATQIILTNNQADQGNDVTVILDDAEGIHIRCDKDITITSKETVSIQSKESDLGISAQNQVEISDGNGGKIELNEIGLALKGKDVQVQ